MPIYFDCVCGTEIEALDGQVGLKVMCPACRSDLTVPPRSTAVRPEVVPDLGIVVSRSFDLTPKRMVKPALARRRPGLFGPVLAFFGLAVFAAWLLLPKLPNLVVVAIPEAESAVEPLAGPPQARADAGARAEWPRIKAEAEGAAEPARLDLGAMPEEQTENRKHRWLGGGGRVVRMLARQGMECVEVPRGQAVMMDLNPGMNVALADDITPVDESQDVMMGTEFDHLKEVFSPGLEHRREDTRLAGEGLIFTVPRGTLAMVLEWKPLGMFGRDDRLVRVRFGDEAAWVYGAHLRKPRERGDE